MNHCRKAVPREEARTDGRVAGRSPDVVAAEWRSLCLARYCHGGYYFFNSVVPAAMRRQKVVR